MKGVGIPLACTQNPDVDRLAQYGVQYSFSRRFFIVLQNLAISTCAR